MKKFSGVLSGLKMVLKYSAYIIVAVDVLSYAVGKFEALEAENEKDSINGDKQ